MTTRSGGRWPKGLLWPVLVAPFAIVILVVALVLGRGIERALSHSSGTFQLAIFVVSAGVALASLRYLLRADETNSSAIAGHPSLAETPRESAVAGGQTGTAVADAIAHLDSKLATNRDERERQEMLTKLAIAEIRGALAQDAAAVTDAVESVAGLFAVVAEHIDENRYQSRVLRAAVSHLPLPSSSPLRIEVHGNGTFAGSVDISGDREISIVDDAEAPVEAAPEVMCRDNDRWVGDVEILEVSRDADSVRYWLRRKSDGYIFPRCFDEDDLRFAEVAHPEPDLVDGSVVSAMTPT